MVTKDNKANGNWRQPSRADFIIVYTGLILSGSGAMFMAGWIAHAWFG